MHAHTLLLNIFLLVYIYLIWNEHSYQRQQICLQINTAYEHLPQLCLHESDLP